ncbi:hypothetical protein [Nocardioides sp. YIM 152315]|nr:hypothetical protein [Nocardioides sp. YIM 152315]MDF1604507.1 hypothetical protein [Nocardioides sp. YIM 152315]
MNPRLVVRVLIVLALLALLPVVVQKVLLRLTGTVVREERRSR